MATQASESTRTRRPATEHEGRDGHGPGQSVTERAQAQHAAQGGWSSSSGSIADTLVLKDANIYFLSGLDGHVPPGAREASASTTTTAAT